MKIFYLILSLWTGGDGNDLYIFDKPTFMEEIECVNFVKHNFLPLNEHVNKEHGTPGDTPNLFFCIRNDELKKKINEIEKGQQI